MRVLLVMQRSKFGRRVPLSVMCCRVTKVVKSEVLIRHPKGKTNPQLPTPCKVEVKMSWGLVLFGSCLFMDKNNMASGYCSCYNKPAE